MPNILKELKLTELSLVDRPANPEALAPIFKSDSEGECSEMEDEIIEMPDDIKVKLKPYMDKGMSAEDAMKAYEQDMKKSEETLKSENERLRKALIDNGFVIKAETIEKRAPVEYIEVEGEKIAKSDIPAPILKRLEEAEVAKREAEITKRAEKFPNLKQEVAKSFVELDLDKDEELMAFLTAVDAMFGKSMEEAGETSVDADLQMPADKLEKMAREYAAEKSVTYEKAFSEIIKTAEGKELLKQSMKKED